MIAIRHLDQIGIKTKRSISLRLEGYAKRDVEHWLHYARNDMWYKSQHPVTMKNVSLAIGNSGFGRNDIYDHVINKTSGLPADNLVQKIGALMDKMEKREVAFYKSGKGKEYSHVWLEPPREEPRILPLSTQDEWSLFARCLRCLNNKFMPVKMNGKNHACCYRCIPPSQYKAIGAKLQKISMIRDSLVKMGLI